MLDPGAASSLISDLTWHSIDSRETSLAIGKWLASKAVQYQLRLHIAQNISINFAEMAVIVYHRYLILHPY